MKSIKRKLEKSRKVYYIKNVIKLMLLSDCFIIRKRKSMPIPKHIFRKYDIRGLSSLYGSNQNTEIDARFVRGLAHVLANYYKERGHHRILLAYDTRQFSIAYHDILCEGLNKCGCDVVSLGMVPTPCLYFAVHFLQIYAGIMITASHNDAHYNGFKIWEGKKTLCADEIQEIYKRMCAFFIAKDTKSLPSLAHNTDQTKYLHNNHNHNISHSQFRTRKIVKMFSPKLDTIVRAYSCGVHIDRQVGGLTSAFKIKVPYLDALCTQVISAFPNAFLPMQDSLHKKDTTAKYIELLDFSNRRSPIFKFPSIPDNGLRRRIEDEVHTLNKVELEKKQLSNTNYISLNTGISHEANDNISTESEEMNFFPSEYFNKDFQYNRREGEWAKHVAHILETSPLLPQNEITKKSLTIVVDGANASAGDLFCDVLKEITYKTGFDFHVIPLHCTPSTDFPNHAPDPTVKENCKDLCYEVLSSKADYGIAFDGDGDRMVLVDKNARIIDSDVLLSILARDVLLRTPGARILADVKCSQNFFKEVESLGGVCIVAPTGHSMMKANMIEKEAHLGGEFSGHFFHAQDFSKKKIRDVQMLPFRSAFFHSPFTIHKESPPVQIDWFGTDDGLLSALRALAVLLERGWDLTQFPVWDYSVSSPEIYFPCKEEKKEALMTLAKVHFSKKYDIQAPTAQEMQNQNCITMSVEKTLKEKPLKITTVDGLRIDFDGAWFLIRPSHTTNCLTLRFEAKTQGVLDKLQKEVKDTLFSLLNTI